MGTEQNKAVILQFFDAFWPIFVSVIAFLLLVLHVFGPSTFHIDQTAGFLLILVALPWLYRIVENIKLPFAEIKFRELKREVKEAKDAAAIALILSSISSNALDHLRLLRDHTKDPTEHYFIPDNNEIGLCGELNHLKILGYIRFKGHNNINGVENLPRGNRTVGVLYDTIEVTDTGRKFLELHDKLAEYPNLSDQR